MALILATGCGPKVVHGTSESNAAGTTGSLPPNTADGLPVVAANVLPARDVAGDSRLVIGQDFHYMVPNTSVLEGVMVEGVPGWRYTPPRNPSASVTVWGHSSAIEGPATDWLAARQESWTADGAILTMGDDLNIRVEDTFDVSDRYVLQGDGQVTLRLLYAWHGRAYEWGCRLLEPTEPDDLFWLCQLPSGNFHVSPPPLVPEGGYADVSDAAPLVSTPKRDWPCGHYDGDSTWTEFQYGELETCTLDPLWNAVGCPTRAITSTHDDGSPAASRTTTHALIYDQKGLLQTHSKTTDTEFGTPRTRVSQFAYDDASGRMIAITGIDRSGGLTDDSTVRVAYPDTNSLLVDPAGRHHIWLDRGGNGQIVHDRSTPSRRRISWDGARPTDVAYLFGQEVEHTGSYHYDCKDFPTPDL